MFVIDDEEGICRFVAMTIEGLGLEAETYHNVQEAIAALERGHPDMIFLDLALEGSDAVEMLRLLGDKRYSGVVQLMSGSSPGLLDDVRRIGARHGLQMRDGAREAVPRRSSSPSGDQRSARDAARSRRSR